jgi:hypothetical protein
MGYVLVEEMEHKGLPSQSLKIHLLKNVQV